MSLGRTLKELDDGLFVSISRRTDELLGSDFAGEYTRDIEFKSWVDKYVYGDEHGADEKKSIFRYLGNRIKFIFPRKASVVALGTFVALSGCAGLIGDESSGNPPEPINDTPVISPPPVITSPLVIDLDPDKDGLPTDWELSTNLGLDPTIPDILLEVDYFENCNKPIGGLPIIVERYLIGEFHYRGINLVLDSNQAGRNNSYGGQTINPSIELEPEKCQVVTLQDVGNLSIDEKYFHKERLPYFHYLIVANYMGPTEDGVLGGQGEKPGTRMIIAENKHLNIDTDQQWLAMIESITHEFGHNMGLDHVNETNNIMSPRFDHSKGSYYLNFNSTQYTYIKEEGLRKSLERFKN